jgi:hypothetical protein
MMERTPKPQERLRVASKLEPTTGMIVPQTRLQKRRPDAVGTEHGYVGGHGGDVWWLRHDGDDPDDIAPYSLTELEPLEAAAPT